MEASNLIGWEKIYTGQSWHIHVSFRGNARKRKLFLFNQHCNGKASSHGLEFLVLEKQILLLPLQRWNQCSTELCWKTFQDHLHTIFTRNCLLLFKIIPPFFKVCICRTGSTGCVWLFCGDLLDLKTWSLLKMCEVCFCVTFMVTVNSITMWLSWNGPSQNDKGTYFRIS